MMTRMEKPTNTTLGSIIYLLLKLHETTHDLTM